jgi:hypothetical protein
MRRAEEVVVQADRHHRDPYLVKVEEVEGQP